MDPVSQGILGASLAGSLSKSKKLKLASLCGFFGGLTPDLDILIKSSTDPLLSLEFHRHFTHSIFFVPLGALITGLFLFLFLRKSLSFKEIYFYSAAGFLTHGFLDSCTSYGTQLLWPVLDKRFSWNIISIIDPIYTFTLLIFILISIFMRSLLYVRLGVFFSCVYLVLGVYQHQNIKEFIKKVAIERGHKIERILLNPTIGNNILWRTVYQTSTTYYIDAVYSPIIGQIRFKKGTEVSFIDKETVFSDLPQDSLLRNDIRRFAYFSQNYIFLHPDYDNVMGDLRYGTLPYDYKALWGIQFDLKKPESHANFVNLRNFDNDDYSEFWKMLKGKF